MRAHRVMPIAVTLLLFLALPAWAADFRFSVPVEMHGLHPDITQVRVNCTVASTPTFSINPYVKIAQGISPASPVVNGNFNGVLVVQANHFPNKDPASGRSYRCDLHWFAKGQWFIATTNPAYPVDPSKPRKTVVVGTF